MQVGLNTVNLVGRLGADPDLKYFESGSVLATIRLAVNRRRRDDEPDWFDAELWGQDAENAGNNLRKGAQVGITGSLKFSCWKDRNTGVDRSKPVIQVSRIEYLGKKPQSSAEAGGYNEEF